MPVLLVVSDRSPCFILSKSIWNLISTRNLNNQDVFCKLYFSLWESKPPTPIESCQVLIIMQWTKSVQMVNFGI